MASRACRWERHLAGGVRARPEPLEDYSLPPRREVEALRRPRNCWEPPVQSRPSWVEHLEQAELLEQLEVLGQAGQLERAEQVV